MSGNSLLGFGKELLKLNGRVKDNTKDIQDVLKYAEIIEGLARKTSTRAVSNRDRLDRAEPDIRELRKELSELRDTVNTLIRKAEDNQRDIKVLDEKVEARFREDAIRRENELLRLEQRLREQFFKLTPRIASSNGSIPIEPASQ